MSGTGTKKQNPFLTANELYNWIYQMDPVINMKALNILKVHDYLYRAHKKVSLLSNCVVSRSYRRSLKKIDLLINL